MQFIASASSGLTPELIMGNAAYRYRVFVEKLGWDLNTENGLELDQFDRADTLYVIARGDDDEVIGTARLLPTTRPYLLSEVFPQLLHGLRAPCSPQIWELSRFAAVDFNARATSALSHSSSPATVGLLRAAMRAAQERGAQRMITVSPIGVERLLRKLGLRAHRAAPPCMVGGQSLVSLYIELDAA
jgi:acyl homoserine lactone synthase